MLLKRILSCCSYSIPRNHPRSVHAAPVSAHACCSWCLAHPLAAASVRQPSWLAHGTAQCLDQQLRTAQSLICGNGLIRQLLSLAHLIPAEAVNLVLEAGNERKVQRRQGQQRRASQRCGRQKQQRAASILCKKVAILNSVQGTSTARWHSR